jgi:hypothetical protein
VTLSYAMPMPVRIPFMMSNDISSLTDAVLVARLEFEDQTAFSELFDRYSGVAFGLAKRVRRVHETLAESSRL